VNAAPDSQTRFWLALLRAPGIGPAHGGLLLDRFGSPQAVFDAGAGAWRAAGLPEALRDSLRNPDWAGVEQDLRWLDGDGRHLVARDDPRYPSLLREITYAPLVLFCQGDPALLERPQLAVVGSRSATPQGLEAAEGFAAELARRGLVITSGLALEQGREVFAIPGSIHSPLSRGGHALLRQGAKLTESVHDVLEELAPMLNNDVAPAASAAPGAEGPGAPDLEPMQQRVMDALGFDATSFDILVERLALPVETLGSALLALELQGLIAAVPGGAYVRLRGG